MDAYADSYLTLHIRVIADLTVDAAVVCEEDGSYTLYVRDMQEAIMCNAWHVLHDYLTDR